MAYPLLDELPQPGSAPQLLILLVLVLEHLLYLLEDLEGVRQVYILGEGHVLLAPGAVLSIPCVLVLEADLANDCFAAGCYQPLSLLIADHTGVVLHGSDELVLREGLGCPRMLSQAALGCRLWSLLSHLG
jgi:hypothetical protein